MILTFFGPFLSTTNGFFATWVATIASLLLLSSTFNRVEHMFRNAQSNALADDDAAKSLIGLAFGSSVVFGASIEPASIGLPFGMFGMSVGIISAVIALVLYILFKKGKLMPALKKVGGRFRD